MKNIIKNVYKKYKNDFIKLIEYHGKRETEDIFVEELSELITECSKMIKHIQKRKRMKNYSEFMEVRRNIIEEAADVLISVMLYFKLQGISVEEFLEELDIKMRRNIKRTENVKQS